MLIRLLPARLGGILFSSLEAKEAFLNQVAEVRERHSGRPIAFALYGGGALEFWAIKLFLRERFGDAFEPKLATRIPSVVIESPGTVFRRIASKLFLMNKARSRIRLCVADLTQGRPIILNLEATDRKRAFEVPVGERELAYLQEQVPNLLIIPVVFIWRRKRLALKASPQDLGTRIWRGLLARITFPWTYLLGDPYHPTFIRKMALLLRRYERSTIRLTAPIEINAANIKALRRKILTTILQEKKVILGPMPLPPRLIGEGILRSASFSRIVHTLAQEEEVSERTLYRRAEKYFNELAADFSYFTIEALAWVLNWVFTRIFDDLTLREEDFDSLRLAAREGPLLLVPSHKSYFDFLIMSYVLFSKDIAPPHIAAGINLNFWPFGAIAKNAGAFFIKRSFRGNILYSEILRRYIAALLQGKHNVEFFIEGARSRSGKLAPPKYGLLKMIVDSHYDGLIQEKVRVVPISITYDRVTEANAHKRELEGGEKVQESALGLFKSTKILFRRFGEVHVRIADSLSLEDWLSHYAGDDVNTRKLGIQKLAFEVCHRINRNTPVPATGLLCALLLAKPGSSMSAAELDAWLARIQTDLQRLHVPLVPILERDFARGCQRALAGLIEDKIIERHRLPSGAAALRIPDKQRIAALYYKNTAIHALLNAAVAGYQKGANEELLDLRALLQFEFFFSDKEVFLRNLIHVPEGIMKDLYARMLDDVFESITLGLRALGEWTELAADDKEWRNRLMKFGRAAAGVTRREGANTQSFAAFIDMAKNRKWLVPAPKAKEGYLRAGDPREIAKAFERVREFRQRLQPWDALRLKYLGLPYDEPADSPNVAPRA